jgi:hypothetical protein
MTTAAYPDLISPDRPPPPAKLAFILSKDNLWWPAIIYSSYGEAMQERDETLSLATKNYMARRVISAFRNKQPQGKIAQLLGYNDNWLEYSETKSIYTFLHKAVAQTFTQVHQHAFDVALTQVEHYLENAQGPHINVLAGGINLFPTATSTVAALTTTSTKSPTTTEPTKKRATAADPMHSRIWGREKPTTKRTKTTTTTTTQKQSQRETKLTSHKAQRSREDFYVYKELWSYLKEEGWETKKASNPLHDWYWVRPGVDVKTAELGKDYFSSFETVVQWAKSVDYRNRVGVTTTDESSMEEEDSVEQTSSEEESHISASVEDESHTDQTLATDDDDSRVADDEASHVSFDVPAPKRKPTFSWKKLRAEGWKMVEAQKFFPDADATVYWVRPHVTDIRTAEYGEDYFASPTDIMEWFERQDSMENDSLAAITQQEDSTPLLDRTVPQDPSKPQFQDDSTDNDSTQNDSSRFQWAALWSRLKKYGWKHCNASKFNKLHNIYYVRPSKTVEGGKEGEDYFLCAQDVIAFEMRQEGVEEIPKRRITLSPGKSIKSTKTKSAKKEGKQPKSRRITLSPAKSIKSAKKQPKSAKKEGKQPKSAKKLTKKQKLAKQQKMAKPVKPKPPPPKTDWWQLEAIPSFTDIWILLKDKLHFRYSNGAYKLPKNAKAGSWPLDHDMRKFLCQNGIPNYNTDELTQDEHTDLLRWTAFANVPVKDSTSIKKLEYVHVLTEPMNLLAQIGFEDSGTGSYYHKATNQTYDSLEQLRSVLRGMSDLMGAGVRRKTKMPLSEDQVLQLRLWAALSKEPLPVFCS